MIRPPLNDVVCLSKLTDVAKEAVSRSEVIQIADRFLDHSNHDPAAALGAVRAWLRTKKQKHDAGWGPGPRVDCGDVQQRVDYLGREPNCVERSILFIAIAELIDPDTPRQMATIKTSEGLHTFPVENGRFPVVLDPNVTRNALNAGVWAIRNGGGGAHHIRPREMVEWALELATEPAESYRNGARRIDDAERALARLWRGRPIGRTAQSARNSLNNIAWTFALAEQAARAAGGHGLDAVRIAGMAVQNLLTRQARNWRFSIGGQKFTVNTGKLKRQITHGATAIFRTAEDVAKSAGPLAGPVLKSYLSQHGVPPQLINAFARSLQNRGLNLGPLGLQTPTPGSLEGLAFDSAVAQLAAATATKKKTTKKG